MITIKPTTKLDPIRDEDQLSQKEINKLSWLPKKGSRRYAYKIQLASKDILLTTHNNQAITSTNGNANSIHTIAKRDQNGAFVPIGKAILKSVISNYDYRFSISEIGGSKAGDQYFIYVDNDTKKQYLEGHNKKGKNLFNQTLGKIYDSSNGTSYTYQSILADKKGYIYLTGYEDGRDTNIFVEKRNGKSGQLIWSVKPFDKQNLDSSGSYWSIRTGEHPSILLNKNQLLTAASGWFTGIRSHGDAEATYLARINLSDGSTKSQHYLNNDANYDAEFFVKSDSTILTNQSGSYIIEGITPLQGTYSSLAVAGNNKSEESKDGGIYIQKPSKLNKKSADKITNFNPSTDTLEIDTDSFGIDSSATFAAARNKRKLKKLAKKDFDFLYDQKKGGLYFNENGSDKGFGDGGIIAILKGAPDLTSGNLEFI